MIVLFAQRERGREWEERSWSSFSDFFSCEMVRTQVKFKLRTGAGWRLCCAAAVVISLAPSLFDMLIYKSITADNPAAAAEER